MPKILISKAFSFLYFIVLSLTNGTTYQEAFYYGKKRKETVKQKLTELFERGRLIVLGYYLVTFRSDNVAFLRKKFKFVKKSVVE